MKLLEKLSVHARISVIVTGSMTMASLVCLIGCSTGSDDSSASTAADLTAACHAVPECPAGERELAQGEVCAVCVGVGPFKECSGGPECHSVSKCGNTIDCTPIEETCPAAPECPAGERELAQGEVCAVCVGVGPFKECSGGPECHSVSKCGNTITCVDK